MSYIVFARKYRPQTFDDVIGQSHITATLKNAISQGRVAHAYLFAGPRGVGKTTTARILAKALDCEKGPSPEPCNTCARCEEITRGGSLDILEIDGASNRGIDEIRNLRENVKFAPSRGRFKVYIIDEVHMLTPEAFNALLKTLEEPPPHVKFIFATTQPYKVPSTILSRCQRFDFRRIATAAILESLKRIAEDEKLKIGDDALSLIAKHADGSMRDAQVTLDQITSSAQGKVAAEDVTRILGVVGDDILFELSGAVDRKDPAAALKTIDLVTNEGKDPFQVVLSLIEHFRHIAIAKIGKDLNSLIDAGAEKIKRYEDEAKKFTIEDILYVIYTLSNTMDFIRKSGVSRIPFEAALLKLTRAGSVMSIADIIKRVEALEKADRIHRPVSSIAASGIAGNGGEEETRKETGVNTRESTWRRSEDRPSGLAEKGEAMVAIDTAEAKPSAAATSAELDEVLSAWVAVIDHIKAKKISIASYLQEGYPVGLEGSVLRIGFPKEFQFHKEMLDLAENRRLIEEAIRTVLNVELKTALLLVEPVDMPDTMKVSKGSEETGNAMAGGDDNRGSEIDPIVKTALDIFSGEIKNVRSTRERAR